MIVHGDGPLLVIALEVYSKINPFLTMRWFRLSCRYINATISLSFPKLLRSRNLKTMHVFVFFVFFFSGVKS